MTDKVAGHYKNIMKARLVAREKQEVALLRTALFSRVCPRVSRSDAPGFFGRLCGLVRYS